MGQRPTPGGPTRRQVLVGAAHCAALAPVLSLVACGRAPRAATGFELRGRTMGTTYAVEVAASAAGLDRLALHEELAGVLGQVDRQMSVWRPDAELARLNAAPVGRWIEVSPATLEVARAALARRRDSNGAFDPTLGALVDLWGFGPSRSKRAIPEPGRIEALRLACGPDAVQWRRSPAGLCRMHSDVRMDLSSIAQGYAVDALADLLAARGVHSALIELGGELRAVGQACAGRPWRVAVERPGHATRSPLCVVNLSDRAIGTSGVKTLAFEADGRRQAHILDPRTGRPVAHDLLAVSVIADTAMRADAEATTLLVLGPEEGAKRAQRLGLAALFAREAGPDIHVTRTAAFSERVVEEERPA